MALLPQPGHRLLHRTALVQLLLGKVDIKMDAEVRQRGLDVRHLRDVGRVADHGERRLVRQFADGGVLMQDGLGEIIDVLPRIAALGGGTAVDRRQHGGGKIVHLRAGVIDVILSGHVRTAGPQHPRDRIAQRGPAGMAQVQWTSGVGGDELHVDDVAGQGLVLAVMLPGLQDGLGQQACR